MALATECWERVCVVVSNVANLCPLINVADEQHFLQKCMLHEAFQECMAGDTNMTRVQILCQKMVHEITAGNMNLFDALCTYFLNRSEAYKCMYQRFTAIGSSNSANGASSSNAVQSELLSLQERVKELTEELQHLRESNATTDYQSELVAVREILTENETASQSDESVPVIVDVVANHPMEVEKLEPAVVAEEPLLMAAQLSPCTIDNKPVSCDWMKPDTDMKPVSCDWMKPDTDVKLVSCDWMKPDTDVKQNVKEETQPADDVSALTGDDKENDNVDVLNVSEADATNETMNQGYQCEYCVRKFRYKAAFVKHVRTHNVEKPFACQYCEKRCSRKGNLLEHYRTHTVEKPFACQYCEKRFSLKGSLRRHVRVHTGEKPFACKECDRRFSQSHTLLTHYRIHTGEKPFACKICNKRFALNRNLVRHCRIHTGDRPYVCEHCGMAFRFKSAMRQHLLKEHSLATLKKQKSARGGSSSLS